MMDQAALGAVEATAQLAEMTGVPYRLLGGLSGGETGAHLVVDAMTGERFVLKWEPDGVSQALRAEAVVLSERLRSQAGWPVPRQRTHADHGLLFVLQDFMAGSSPASLDDQTVEHLLALHEARVGLARPGDPSHWPEALIDTLTIGGRGYCLHEPLRGYDKRTARLVASIEEFGAGLDPDDLNGDDIIHWDLHPGNLLVEDGALTAIVDTDFAMVGDAAFDLVTLALTSLALPCGPGVHSRLFAIAFEELDEAPNPRIPRPPLPPHHRLAHQAPQGRRARVLAHASR
jgi:hypothetical protein